MRTLRRRRGNRAQRRRFVWLWRNRSASLPGGVPAGASATAIVLHKVLRAGLATASLSVLPASAGGGGGGGGSRQGGGGSGSGGSRQGGGIGGSAPAATVTAQWMRTRRARHSDLSALSAVSARGIVSASVGGGRLRHSLPAISTESARGCASGGGGAITSAGAAAQRRWRSWLSTGPVRIFPAASLA